VLEFEAPIAGFLAARRNHGTRYISNPTPDAPEARERTAS